MAEYNTPADIPRVSWDAFLASLDWQQGEHVTLIGHTGSGKTTLALALLPRRSYVVATATKPEDKTMSSLIRRDKYKRIAAWPPGPTRRRVVLWPPINRPSDIPVQRAVFADALGEIYAERGWCVCVDEVWYLSKFLGLGRVLELFWSQGRSIGLSLVAATQRPAYVPLMMYSQATHVFLWRENDPANLKRIRELDGGLNSSLIQHTVASLPKFECLYLNTRTGHMCITRAPKR